MEKLIHSHVFNPENTLFKIKGVSQRAELHEIYCSNTDNCELYKCGQCICRSLIGNRCPYGRYHTEIGPTKRSRKLHSWINDRKSNVGYLDLPPNKLARVGEYIYLPYGYIGISASSFKDGGLGLNLYGGHLLHKEDWNIETVLKIVDFIPRNIYMQPITKYQEEIVPKFVTHLGEFDDSLYQELVKQRPRFNQAPNHVGRLAYLLTLNAGITIPPYNTQYPVEWYWDGKKLTTTNKDAYSTTWGHIKHPQQIKVELIPSEKTVVVVQDNTWVNKDTKFVD